MKKSLILSLIAFIALIISIKFFSLNQNKDSPAVISNNTFAKDNPVNNKIVKDNLAAIRNNKFAIDLFKNFEPNKNLFFSPFSISSALAIAVNGAQGTTLEAMKNVLEINNNLDLYNTDFKNLFTLFRKDRIKDSLRMSIANALWGQYDYNFKNSFLNITKDYFDSGLKPVDFKSQQELEKSRIKINEWVEKQTNGKIKDLIKPNVLDTLTRLIITNAIYFNGRWLNQFDISFTKEEVFYSNNKKIKADFLNRKEVPLKYYEDREIKIVEMPYLGEEFSLLIMLPNDKNGLRDVEDNLSFENYVNWIKDLKPEKVDISIPKFKLESELMLKEILNKMGMSIAFSNSADFSGMIEVDKNQEKDGIKISDVIHKSFIDVNEVGTEASAATAVIFIYTTEVRPIDKNVKVFKADHPFIFLIKENSTNTILFLGRVTNPKIN